MSGQAYQSRKTQFHTFEYLETFGREKRGKKRKVVEYFSRFLVTDILFSGGTQQRLREEGKVFALEPVLLRKLRSQKKKKKERKQSEMYLNKPREKT